MISQHLHDKFQENAFVDKVLTRAQSECQEKKKGQQQQQQFHCSRSADAKDRLQDWMRFRLRVPFL